MAETIVIVDMQDKEIPNFKNHFEVAYEKGSLYYGFKRKVLYPIIKLEKIAPDAQRDILFQNRVFKLKDGDYHIILTDYDTQQMRKESKELVSNGTYPKRQTNMSVFRLYLGKIAVAVLQLPKFYTLYQEYMLKNFL